MQSAVCGWRKLKIVNDCGVLPLVCVFLRLCFYPRQSCWQKYSDHSCPPEYVFCMRVYIMSQQCVIIMKTPERVDSICVALWVYTL